MYSLTTATRKLLKLRKRLRVIAGGTSASKTISILLILIDKAQSDSTPKLTSIVSESIPHLKRGAMRDFLSIMQEHGYFKEASWNRTDFVYTFETGSKIEFFGADSPDKTRGPRRDRLYINECNNVPYGAFDQMEVRTKGEIWLDFNPTNEFWYYTEVLPHRPDDIDFLTLTYKDNEALDKAIVQSIESRRANKGWWQVYGLGQLGEAEGRVFTNWETIDEVPPMARLWRRGLDFGYTNDPTTVTAVYEYEGGIVLDEELYQKGMSNKDIADYVKNLKEWNVLVKADSAEPKSVDELRSYGLTILPAQKGQGSVNQGIQKLQGMKVSVTKRSLNLIKEYRNYMWETDKEGRILNVPIDGFNHCLDGIRYAVEDHREKREKSRIVRLEGGNSLGYGRRPVFRSGML